MPRATLNQPVPLQAFAPDGNPFLFGRATVYSGSSPLAVINLPHLVDGIYSSSWTFDTEGYFPVRYQLFLDSGHTTLAPAYGYAAEMIEVSSDKTNLMRILGLVHDNAVLDQQQYTPTGDLISGRLRVYDSKVNALAAGGTGLVFTYSVLAAYTAGVLSSYKVVREP